jgi:hypothetical protein
MGIYSRTNPGTRRGNPIVLLALRHNRHAPSLARHERHQQDVLRHHTRKLRRHTNRLGGRMSIIVGYTTREHLLLDLDDTTKFKAVGLIRQIMRAWPEVGDALLLYSSTCTCKRWMYNPSYMHLKLTRRRENYHVVFNNNIGYEKCVQIILTLVALDALDRQFAEIRQFRGDMTLRVNWKPLSTGSTPPPQLVTYIYNRHTRSNDRMIQQYLSFRQLVLSSGRSSRPRKTRPLCLIWRFLRRCGLNKLVLARLTQRIRLRSRVRCSFNHPP